MRQSIYKSLAFKLSALILLIEVIVLAMSSSFYYFQFARQVDERVEARLMLPSILIENNLLRIISIRDRETVTLLLGEDVQDILIVEEDGSVLFTMNDTYRNLNINDIPELISYFTEADEENEVYRETDGNYNILTTVSKVNISNPVENSQYTMLIRTRIDSSEAEKQSIAQLLFVGSLVIIGLTTMAIVFFFNRIILNRIYRTSTVLRAVEDGKFDVYVEADASGDELSFLQNGVNSMIRQLHELFEDLENRVAVRTRDLQAASTVSNKISQVLDLEELLQAVVELACKSFDLYFATIFVLSEDGEKLLRMSSYGLNKDVDIASAIPIHSTSVVSTVAKTRSILNLADVDKSDTFMRQAALTDTRSELGIPIMLGDKLLGVFDVQSNQTNAFKDEDIFILRSLAEQIGVAIRNAQLFSEVRSAKSDADRANTAKSQFLASMSHELRTPLNSILNFTKFVANGVLGEVNDEQKKVLGDVYSSAKHLLSLINDVLDISKIEAGSLNLFLEENVDLSEELSQLSELAKSLLMDKPVKFALELPEHLPHLTVDRRRIKQIVINLVSNACKFTEKGEIVVSTKEDKDYLYISVRDSGIGIAPEDHQRVFEVFQQAEGGMKVQEGTGLGLAISMRLAEMHKGSLWVESEVGKGSTFYLMLPLESSTSSTSAN